jgi:uncharacterized membrane protein
VTGFTGTRSPNDIVAGSGDDEMPMPSAPAPITTTSANRPPVNVVYSTNTAPQVVGGTPTTTSSAPSVSVNVAASLSAGAPRPSPSPTNTNAPTSTSATTTTSATPAPPPTAATAASGGGGGGSVAAAAAMFNRASISGNGPVPVVRQLSSGGATAVMHPRPSVAAVSAAPPSAATPGNAPYHTIFTTIDCEKGTLTNLL